MERQLRERGVVLKKGTLMDATLVEAQVRRPSLKERRGAKSPTDLDAEWTYSHRERRAHFATRCILG